MAINATPITTVGDSATPASGRFKKLAGQLPGVIGQQAQAGQSTNLANLQQAVQQTVAAGGQASTAQVQAAGAKTAAQRGQTALGAATTGVKQAGQLGQLATQEGANSRKLDLARRGMELDKQNADLEKKLAETDMSLKRELVDKQQQFQKDELGRSIMNERQLADFELSQVQSDEALKNMEQQFNYYSKLRMNMLEAAHKKVMQAMTNAYQFSEADKDGAVRIKLAQAKAALEEKMRKEQARQRNRGAMFSAAGTVLGAVAGAPAGPAGAMAGASIGNGLGSILASQTAGSSSPPSAQTA